MKNAAKTKPFIVMCTIALAFSLIFGVGLMPAYADDGQENTPWPKGPYIKVSDPDTTNTVTTPYFNPGVLENGLLWTDKSVNKDTAVIYNVDGGVEATYTADPTEFLVTLSALSEGYLVDITQEPLDVVFIVDLSGSMTYRAIDFGTDLPTEGNRGDMRVDALVAALNNSIKILMDSNIGNRVSVVAFYGEAGRFPMATTILDLGRYTEPTNAYFFVDDNNVGTAPAYNGRKVFFNVSAGLSPASGVALGPNPNNWWIEVYGGTPTQRGMYEGAQVLMNNSDITYTDPSTGASVARIPTMILITDGEPTFGWNDYVDVGYTSPNPAQNQDWGDALQPDMGIDLLCVATASYWKKQVYNHYFGATPGTVGYYTVGMFIYNEQSRALLYPTDYAYENIHHLSCTIGAPAGTGGMGHPPEQCATLHGATIYADTYNMGYFLDQFLPSGIGTTGDFLARDMQLGGLWSNTYDIANITNDTDPLFSVDNYYYSDEYFTAENADELTDALKTITSQVIRHGNSVTAIAPDANADFSGYLTFSDVIGQYMRFQALGGFWIWDPNVQGYDYFDGEAFAMDLSNPLSPNRAAFLDTLSRQLDDPPDLAAATTILNTSIAGGLLYYNSLTDYGNQLRWYADAEKYYVGPFYDASGNPAPVPAEAKCIMDLYPISGTAYSTVTGEPTDVLTISFVVLTALVNGDFADADDSDWNVPDRTLVVGQQIVRWYVPGSLIPMRTIQSQGGDSNVAELVDASPIRVVYSVGLPPTLTLADIAVAYKTPNRLVAPNAYGYPALYVFYTNQWKAPLIVPVSAQADLSTLAGSADTTMVFCQISQNNPYYYYFDTSGQVPVFVNDAGVFRPAVTGDTGPFFTLSSYFDINMPGYIVESYTPVTNSAIVNPGAPPSPPYISSGTPKPQSSTYEVTKTSNNTQTQPYVVSVSSVVSGPGIIPVQIRLLGNNGLLGIPDPYLPELPPTGDKELIAAGLLLACGAAVVGLGFARRRRKLVANR